MIKKLKDLYIRYREIILYFIFGVITTVANFVVFFVCTKLFGEDLVLLNNAVAWVAGVVVAFVTNKLFVFDSKSWKPKTAIKEFSEFVAARILSFGFEEFGMWFFITVFNMSDKELLLFSFTISGQVIVKIFLSVVVVVLNYFFSKFIIFKKNIK